MCIFSYAVIIKESTHWCNTLVYSSGSNLLLTLCTFSFLLTWCKLGLSKKREPQLRNCHHKIDLYASVWIIFLINNKCGKAHPTMVRDTTGQVILGYKRNQTAMYNKPVSSIPHCASFHDSWFLPCLSSLPWLPLVIDKVKQMNPFLPTLLLVSVLV